MICSRALVLSSILAASVAALPLGCSETTIVDTPWDGAIPSGFAPLPIRSGALVAFVTNSFSDTISVVDLETRSVVAQRPVGRSAVDVDGPHHLAIDEARGEILVPLSYPAATASPGRHAAHASSERSGYVQRLRLRDLAILGEQRIDPNPGDVIFDARTRTLVVSHFNLTAAFARDAGETRGTLAWFQVPTEAGTPLPSPAKVPTCRAPHGLVGSADGLSFFVACYGDDAVAKVSATSFEVLALWPVGSGTLVGRVTYGPYSVALSPDGLRLAVGCTDSKDVRMLDASSGRLLATLPTDGAAFFPRWEVAGAALAVPVQAPDEVLLFDEASANVFVRRPTIRLDERCLKPHEVHPLDGASMAVVCEGDHVASGTIAFFTDMALTTSVPVGVYPDRMVPLRWP